jgi:hypothetical protein
MEKQSEALRLADELAMFATWRDDFTGTLEKSASELRRLHAENAQLLEALEAVRYHGDVIAVATPDGVVRIDHAIEAARLNI